MWLLRVELLERGQGQSLGVHVPHRLTRVFDIVHLLGHAGVDLMLTEGVGDTEGWVDFCEVDGNGFLILGIAPSKHVAE